MVLSSIDFSLFPKADIVKVFLATVTTYLTCFPKFVDVKKYY